MKNIFFKTNSNFHIRHSTTDTSKIINPILFNNYIINKSLSSDKSNNKILKSKNKINKKIKIPISPNINFNSNNKSKKNSLTKNKCINIIRFKNKKFKKIL